MASCSSSRRALDDDVVGVGVEAVPYELDDRPDRVLLVCEPLDEVIAGFKLNTSHKHILPAPTDIQRSSDLGSRARQLPELRSKALHVVLQLAVRTVLITDHPDS